MKHFIVCRMLGDSRRPETLIADIRQLENAARDPDVYPGAYWKGRTPKSALHYLVFELARVYKRVTGKEAPRSRTGKIASGPFVRLVDEIAKEGPEAIYHAINEYRRRTGKSRPKKS